MTVPVKPDYWGIALALTAALGFSFKAIFVKLGILAGGDAVVMLGLRMIFALPLFLGLLIYSLYRGGSQLNLWDRLTLIGLGFLGFYLSSLLDFIGLQYLSANIERLILFSYPTLILLFGALFFGYTVTKPMILALLLCYGGIGLALADDLRLNFTFDTLIGGAWVFGAAITFAAYSLGSAAVVHRIGPLRLTAYTATAAAAFSLGHLGVVHGFEMLMALPFEVYQAGFALAMVSTVIPIYCQSAANKRLGAGRTAIVATFGPVMTIFLSGWFLGEILSPLQVIGAVCVVTGVILISRH